MKVTDPIADMLTRIRNGLDIRHPAVSMPSSRLKLQVARILKEEGYIENFLASEEGPQGTLKIILKYTSGNEPVIQGIVRYSKPGRRQYCNRSDIPQVLSGLGTAIISTSKGVMTGREAIATGVGGEVLCTIW